MRVIFGKVQAYPQSREQRLRGAGGLLTVSEVKPVALLCTGFYHVLFSVPSLQQTLSCSSVHTPC